jgi:hypothetical protein
MFAEKNGSVVLRFSDYFLGDDRATITNDILRIEGGGQGTYKVTGKRTYHK